MSIDAELFLGFPLDANYSTAFAQLDPSYKSMYLHEGDAYLCEVTYDHTRYLGKRVGPIGDLALLETLQDNIYSLLKKLVPDYPYQQVPLHLFPLVEVSHAK